MCVIERKLTNNALFQILTGGRYAARLLSTRFCAKLDDSLPNCKKPKAIRLSMNRNEHALRKSRSESERFNYFPVLKFNWNRTILLTPRNVDLFVWFFSESDVSMILCRCFAFFSYTRSTSALIRLSGNCFRIQMTILTFLCVSYRWMPDNLIFLI